MLETARSAAGCDLLLLLQDRSSAGGGIESDRKLRCLWTVCGPYTRKQDYSQGAIEICAKGPHTSLLQAPPRVRFTLGKSSIRSRYAESRPPRRA
eukprot:COSAG01_NODE_14240_length_1478_cov_5.235678_1_plen_94_part_10